MALQPEDDTFVWPPPHWGAIGMPAPQQIVEDSPYAEDVAPPEVVAAPVDPTLGPPVLPGIGIPLPVAEDAIATLPPPDTVTGVDAAPINVPPPVEEATAPEPTGPQPDSPDFNPLAPQSWDNTIGQEDLHQMALRHPQEFVAYSQAHDAARAAEQRQQEAIVARKNAEQEEQNYADLRASQAKADQIRDEVANTRIDANRWRESRSVPQSIAAFLSVVIGGLYQARKGGPNIGLEIIDKAIAQDIAEQEANLANKRGVLAEMREAGMSRFQSQQAYRAAVYARAKEDLITKMQDFDPRGTTALEGAKHAYQFDMQIANAAELARQQALKEGMAASKERREVLKAMDDHAESLGKQAAAQQKLAGGGIDAGKAEDSVQPVEYFKTTYPQSPAPLRPMSEKAYNGWLRTTKTGAEATQAIGAESPAEARRRELGIGGPDGQPLVNKDDRPFIARDKTIAEKLTKQATAATEVADIIDEVLAIRERSGGESKIWNSDDRMRLDALQNQLVILQKSGIEGMSSDEDMKKLSEAIGASDVSSFRSRAAGLEKGRERTVGFLNQTLRKNQYTGDPVVVPNRFNLPKPKPTEREEDIQTLIKSDYDNVTTKKANAFAGTKYVDPLSEEAPEQIDTALNKLIGRARGGDASAWKDLELLSTKAVSPTLRSKAAAVLVERPK
jgi:hypothetical protein